MKKGFRELVDEAMAQVCTYPPMEVISRLNDASVFLVDLREARELERDGVIPGAIHVPRGLLEFWVDPESPYFKPVFGEDREFIFFCAAGWRSALATRTMQEMGLPRVAHIDGGFTAWKAAGGPIAEKVSKAR